jgi:hypothetical protein
VIPNTDVDMDTLVAGVSLPVLMPGVIRDGVTYTDAVWIRDSNVPEAVRRGSTEVWLVWCIGNTPRYQAGLFRQYVQMIEMAATGSLLGDLDRLAADPAGQHVQLHVIKPATPLPLDPAYYFGRIDAATLIDLGYQDALRYLRDPRPMVAPWPVDLTRMQTPEPAVAARIVLDGPLGLGHSDPDDGAAAGLAAGTRLRAQLHCEASAGSSRRGTSMRVAGHLDVPGWPARTLIDEGRALVGPGLRALELDVTCTVGDKRFGVAGVPCPEGLAVRICQQGDPAVIGAGVLPFGWAQATAATPTIYATNATSSAESWRARIEMVGTIWRAARGKSAHA